MSNPTAIVTLSDVYAFMGMTQAPPDGGALLQTYINAAQDTVQDIAGLVIPVTFTEYHDGGDRMICLRHAPLLSDPYTHAADPGAITSIVETIGMVNYTLTEQPVGAPVDNFGYTIDDVEQAYIMRRSAGSTPTMFYPNRGNVKVVYTAGRTSVPFYIRQGALELITFWWRIGHEAGGVGNGFVPFAKDMEDESEQADQPHYLVPPRVLALLQPGDRIPVIG